MEQTEQAQTPQPKKSRKGLIIGGIIAALVVIGISGAGSSNTNTNNSSQPATSTTKDIPAASAQTPPPATAQTTPTETPKPVEATPVPTPAATPTPTPTPAPAPKSCPSGYYLNVDNNCIQSPTAAPSAPAGATGVCNDGTYTFAVHHQGACSHHGGVSYWL